MRRWLIFTGLLVHVVSLLPAQTTFYFSQGLGIGAAHQYGRAALYNDKLAYQLYGKTLTTPSEGKGLAPGDASVWKAVKADTSHRFRGESFSNGYVYLTYESKKEQHALLNIQGNDMVFVNGVPRGGDVYRYGWMNLPVRLKKGKNEFYVRVARFGRFGGIAAKLVFPAKPVFLDMQDVTLPNMVQELKNDSLWVGVVLVNTSDKPLSGLSAKAELAGLSTTTVLPQVPAFSTRKVGILVNATSVTSPGKLPVAIALFSNGKNIDSQTVEMECVGTGKHYSRTFVSEIDGSVQYYAVAPFTGDQSSGRPALFLSVHGAEVQAIGQARAYKPKDWGVLVAPTNRRPRGFNWEDWGRLDALEVLEIGKKQYNPDPSRIYLTGHSMGGHGSWFLGATYPGNWAAIAPSAGYPTLASYGSHDGMIPDSAGSPMEAILLRASNTSNVLGLIQNYKGLGVYVAHGDDDRTVSVNYARQMKKLLAGFHTDFSYYEHKGGGHWYGDISVDWPPIFNFFSWHTIQPDTAARHVDFTTANPGVSARMKWVTVLQQTSPLKFSRVTLDLDKTKKRISGKTENISALALDLSTFENGTEINVQLDELNTLPVTITQPGQVLYLSRTEKWNISKELTASQKNPIRSGTFKEPFKNRMVFVYATNGTADENAWALNKARYDAETWYYRGNGAVDIIADRQFENARYPDRGVVLYGNASNNLAWNKLLTNCPVVVSNGKIAVGKEEFKGTDLAAYFCWQRPDSRSASVAVVTGTGLKGMQAANANQYFAGGSGFPDLMIFSAEMLRTDFSAVKMAGFFGNDWSVEKGDFVINR